MELSKEEIQNTLVFLNRANLQGNEALTLVLLQQKFKAALEPPAPTEPPVTPADAAGS